MEDSVEELKKKLEKLERELVILKRLLQIQQITKLKALKEIDTLKKKCEELQK